MTIFCINIGQTYSRISAHLDDGSTIVFKNKENGEDKISSLIYCTRENTFIVGDTARKYIDDNPERILKIREGGFCDECFVNEIDNTVYTVFDVYLFILAKLVEIAEDQGFAVKDVVIAIPVHILYKSMLLKAAEKLKLNIIDIVADPIAAAAYSMYLHEPEHPTECIVFDLGGATLDLAAVCEGRDYDCRQIIYIMQMRTVPDLGGHAWTDVLYNLAMDELSNATGIDKLDFQEETYKKIKIQIEKDIKLLSTVSEIKISAPQEGISAITISREQFESAAKLNIMKSIEYLKQLVDEYGRDKIGSIILVGGASNMPMIKESIKEEFNDIDVMIDDPDNAVVKGGLIYYFEHNEIPQSNIIY